MNKHFPVFSLNDDRTEDIEVSCGMKIHCWSNEIYDLK